jgi:hypothetical protein
VYCCRTLQQGQQQKGWLVQAFAKVVQAVGGWYVLTVPWTPPVCKRQSHRYKHHHLTRQHQQQGQVQGQGQLVQEVSKVLQAVGGLCVLTVPWTQRA